MAYIDAILDKQKDTIHIVERIDGERVLKEFPAEYVLYYDDVKGKHRTIYGTPVSRFSTRNSKEFQKELRIHNNKKLWESDVNPIFRCLAENYLGKEPPQLNIAFFDIEVDFHPELGYSKPEDPFNAITAITVYLSWLDQLVTLAMPPKTLSWESAQEMADKFDNCFLFSEEKDLIDTFLNLIDDADILSGWNSEGYDIPYTVMRTARILSKDDLRRFCLWGQMPKERMLERFGAKSLTFDLVGRVHLDYMQLYRKYTYEERHSYSLDAIGEYELDERKVQYEGTLDQLYNQDFYKFLDYNRQDVLLLAKLDQKLKFVDISNALAHDNTVLLQTTMGTVAVTEQAIINEAHARGMVVPNRRAFGENDGQGKAAGAYVADPVTGMHDYIGAIDLNSLYPSTLRALNMGQETIVGQLRPVLTDHYISEKMKVNGDNFADAWEGLFGSLEYTAVMNQERGTEIIIDWEESGKNSTHSAAEVYDMIFKSDQKWILSANGTIFTYEKEAIIPGLLARWYKERKELQAKKKEATDKKDIAFWDKRQLVKKINLNALYGALLNQGCRFNDKRIGQSTTLTGRIIARHMDAHVNEAITGEYDYTGKAIIYGDTDSVYFSAWPLIKDEVAGGTMEWNKDICVQLYDTIADSVNESFPAFMERACHSPRHLGEIIKAGRELVAEKGLFITKKRYGVLIYDLEGKRLDLMSPEEAKKHGAVHGVGKVKAMGLDLKRSDTPKFVQEFLSEILQDVLTGSQKDFIIDKVREFKVRFQELPAWEKGTPKRVNNLTKFTKAEESQGKANMPGHVRAAMNWNNLKRMNSDNYSMSIVDGMKTIVCKLRANPLGVMSVGYPIDEAHIPQWFKDLPFDDELMETTIVDQKVENLLGVLNWNVSEYTQLRSTFGTLFSFE
jgi:DNA polymerase elongation subunit (family B)